MYDKYFLQLPSGVEDTPENSQEAQSTGANRQNQAYEEVPVTPIYPVEPVPTYTSPQPEQFLSYGIQGAIITLMLGLGKPLIDRLSVMFSERARIKASKEDKALDLQIRGAELSAGKEKDQQDFLQQMLERQQANYNQELKEQRVSNNQTMVEVYRKLDEQIRVLRNSNLLIRELIVAIATSQQPRGRKELPPLDPDEIALEAQSAVYKQPTPVVQTEQIPPAPIEETF
jgi:hypothetical protein